MINQQVILIFAFWRPKTLKVHMYFQNEKMQCLAKEPNGTFEYESSVNNRIRGEYTLANM